jgi:hypothetical protein
MFAPAVARVPMTVAERPAERVPARRARSFSGHAAPGAAFDFSRIPLLPPERAASARAPRPQFKLRVGAIDDPLEREADAVAEQVMRMPAPAPAPLHAGASGLATVRRACAACAAEDDKVIRGKRADPEEEIDGKLLGVPPAITEGLEQRIRGLGAGAALPASERAFFEPRFGHDFGAVRVHADPDAAALARALNARAFTLGPKIVFGPGEFAPGSAAGRSLMAHELAHVVQQRASPQAAVQRDLATPPPEPAPAAQAALTQAQIDAAIRFNRAAYDAARTKQLQDLIGTESTGTWTDADILAVAALQEEYGLHKDGMIGPRTFEFLDRETRREGLARTDANCLLAFNVAVDNPPPGAVVGGERRVPGHFTMRAQFSNYCGCADYEYRQFIRGHKRRTRAGVVTDLGAEFASLPAGRLTPDFREDGDTADAVAVNYGHRGQGNEAFNGYFDDPNGATADQAAGCHFIGSDNPRATFHGVVAGDVLDVLVAFRGEIRRRGTPVETQFWTAINNRFTVP